MEEDDWLERQRAAMAHIAPIFDALEEAVNRCGPIDMVQAYIVALDAVREVDMDKTTLEQFVAVLMADRTHHAPTVIP